MREEKTNGDDFLDKIISKALSENLRVTQVQNIQYEDHALWLLDISQDFFGINQRLKAFLEELYHPYVNPKDTLILMRASFLGDLWWFSSHIEQARIMQTILDLFGKVECICVNESDQKRLIEEFLEFGTALCEQNQSDIAPQIISMLSQWSEQYPRIAIRLSSHFRKTLVSICNDCDSPQDCISLLKSILLATLDFWHKSSDIQGWMASFSTIQLGSTPPPGEAFFEHWREYISASQDLAELAKVPANSEIASLYRDFLREIPMLEARIQYLFFLLGLPTMIDLMDHLLWDLNRQLASLGQNIELSEVINLLDSIFATLISFSSSHRSIVLDCISTVGKSLLEHPDPNMPKIVMGHLVKLGLTPAQELKISSDWQLEVDKNHVKHLRILLDLIAINPQANKDLLAFTIISLTRKGVFIADTDLFQKDVSAFLASNIRPVFVQSKHLLRMFPVFFHEIGAEGEIRDASTNLDELTHRKDKLIHFLRKQIHTESNNSHIALIEKILQYWHSLDPTPLKTIIPEDVWQDIQKSNPRLIAQNQVLDAFLAKNELSVQELLALSWQRTEDLCRSLDDDLYGKRLKLLCYCHFLLKDKYNLEPYDIVKYLSRYSFFDTKEQNRLKTSLNRRDYDSSIRQMLGYIGRLNALTLDPKPSEPWENIYYKRHIAAGIPSMYGTYRETKLEAMGVVFRMENVIRRLFERSMGQLNLEYINGKTLRRVERILELYDFVMKQEMVTSDAFSSAISMLSAVQNVSNPTIEQYLDVFHLLKDCVNEIVNEYYYRFYDYALANMKFDDETGKRSEMIAEEFYRNLLSSSFIIQGLDSFITRIIESLNETRKLFSREDIIKLMSYDSDRLFVHLFAKNARIENQVLLGSKAFFLKRLHQFEFPIPPGFVITTDLYRNRDIINAHPDISNEFDLMLKQNLEHMERYTGLRFGNPDKPLLLSVRSGAPMSLPGAMDTFLNIGLNDEITQRLSQRPNYSWTAWDCYRRLIQSWGMAHGIERDEFDKVMLDYKMHYGVDLKTQFDNAQMKEMVSDYQTVLDRHGVRLEQDPFRQLYLAISHVLDSWDTPRAKLYRSKLHIAEEWGTAVIVQKMVLGNISLESGTGVLFTHADWNHEPGICLNGDFTLCSQGEDVVAGLVHTMPISELDRVRHQAELSLERDFPTIYHSLLRYARQLIEEKNFPHQEIEFTFEGNSEDLLFILQTRNQIIHKNPEYKVLGTSECNLNKVGNGIGIGKGAINGIIVISEEDIKKYQGRDIPLILVRPDTVPEDLNLLFECQGLLTSRGGITSHAAVTATRLGLIGVVNCRELVVNEEESTCRIDRVLLKPGDQISLDATGGTIYLGHYPLQSVLSLS